MQLSLHLIADIFDKPEAICMIFGTLQKCFVVATKYFYITRIFLQPSI